MRNKLIIWLVCGVLLCVGSIRADEATTQKPTTNSTQAPATTPKPINVSGSSICKKCSCTIEEKMLDCSAKGFTEWFNATEWDILQKGDVVFETINLSHNKLKTVPELPTYGVQNLYLGYNDIDSLATDAFHNLTNLTKLDLSHNKITSKVLLPDVFRSKFKTQEYLPLDNMREIDLGYNLLHNLNADLFVHMPKLEVVILGGNTFQRIDQLTLTALAGLVSMKTLDLSYMELDELPDNLLHGPRDLETLILTGNLFDEIPDDLSAAINLKELVLDENPMANLEGDNVFEEMKSLEYLSMSYMLELERVGKGAFSALSKLKTLILSDNPKLNYIDSNAFSIPTNNADIFDYPPLEKLYLRRNNLTLVDRDWIVRWDKINTIDLRANPWVCDCTNHWFIHTLIAQINDSTPLLATGVECDAPLAWKDVEVLELNAQKKTLVCNDNHPEKDHMIVIGLFVGILIGIPLTLASIAIYRRGCFGLVNRVGGTSQPLYNRASFSDDFHI